VTTFTRIPNLPKFNNELSRFAGRTSADALVSRRKSQTYGVLRALVQFKLKWCRSPSVFILLRCQHRIPDSGRTSIFKV